MSEENLPIEESTEEQEFGTEDIQETEAPAGPREYSYKVDGVEGKIDEIKLKKFLDIPEDQELSENLANYAIKAYQKDVAASNRMSTSAQLQKEMKQLVAMARDTPEVFLQELGIDFETLSLQKAKQLLEEHRMDPREREMLQFQREKEAWQNQRMQEQMYQQQQQEYMEAQAEGEYLVNQAQKVAASLGMPYTPIVNEMFRSAMQQGLQMNKILDPEDVGHYVKKEYDQLIAHAAKSMTPDQMVQTFGHDVVSKLKTASVSRMKDPLRSNNPPVAQENAPASRKRASSNDVWKEMREQYGI
jgi:hypothetical protein